MKRFVIETVDGDVVEITNLYDVLGIETNNIESAESCVIKWGEQQWQASKVLGPIYRLQ